MKFTRKGEYRLCLRVFVILIVNFLAVACSNKSVRPDIRILWTNDTHGYLTPVYHREEGDDRFLERAKREGHTGGFAYIATIAKRQRAELKDRTLFFDTGDTWHGTVVPVRMAGAPVVELMNKMGYDAMVPGNVEFFYNRKTLESLFAKAKFPLLIANFYDAEWGERVKLPNVKPYIVKQINGLKLGIVGMTYHWMAKVADHPQWSFGLRVSELQTDIDYLRKTEKVDLVILLSHMGWKADTKYAELVSGIDVIIGAHTHDILYHPTMVYNEKSGHDVLIAQCGSHGKMTGQLDLKVKNRRITSYVQTLFPVHSSKIKADPQILTFIEKLRAPYKAELERVIAVTSSLLYRQALWQSTADNLVSDALRSRTKKDIAIKQPGRYGAAILPGPITVEDVYNIVPAESPIYTMKFNGIDLKMMFESAIDNVMNKNPLQQVGGYMWRFSGIELAIDLSKPFPNRISKFSVNGKAINDNALYSVAEFDMYFRNNSRAIDLLKTDMIGPHEVIAYIEEQKQISSELDHRISDENGHILSDDVHVHETWEKTGRDKFNLETDNVYRYQGSMAKSGKFISSK